MTLDSRIPTMPDYSAFVILCSERLQSRRLAYHLELVILSEAKNLADTDYLAYVQSQECTQGTRFFASLRMTGRSWVAVPRHFLYFAPTLVFCLSSFVPRGLQLAN
jgi:hypothetical protein